VEQRSSVVLDDGGGVIVDIDVALRMAKKIQ